MPHSDSDDSHNILVAEFVVREYPPVKPFLIKWDGTALFEVSHHDAKKKKSATDRPADFSADKLLEALEGEMTSGEWQAVASEEHGIKGKTFFRLKDELVKTGRVSKQGKQYSRVTAGSN